MRFQNRAAAGRALAEALRPFRRPEILVLALPRGGAVIGAEIARALDLPWDVLVVRKIGAPRQPELAVGAIGPQGEQVWNDGLLRHLGLSPADLQTTVAREQAELQRRLRLFRGERPWPVLKDRPVWLVDDGLATGATARVAIRVIRAQRPSLLLLAAPVGASDTVASLAPSVDRLVCLQTPVPFDAVASGYADFPQTTDAEVVALLPTVAAFIP